MRIACVHIPQFALQCVTRLDPSLRRAPVVVVGSGLDASAGTATRVALYSPIVHACSRAAWAHGVRLGMTAVAARGLSPELVPGRAGSAGGRAGDGEAEASARPFVIVNADAQVERETVRAVADALLGATAVVDIGGRVGAGGAHLAMYTEVPVKMRGTSYGEKLVELLDGLGLAARIGIADDKFTAWVAATSHVHSSASDGGFDAGVVSVPRGGSAAFLAPRPLSLLSITPEVQHMLEALGVRSLGEFAALPAPSVARPHVAAAGADFQALARGESGTQLRPYVPEAPIREDVVTSDALGGPMALAMLGARLALRLAGRGRQAARLEISVASTEHLTAPARVISETLVDATASADELAELVGAALGEGGIARGARLRVVVAGEAMPGARDALDAIVEDGRAMAEGSARVSRAASAVGWGEAEVGARPVSIVGSVLGVVLSSTGGGAAASAGGSSSGFNAWALTSPEPSMHVERREGHRRMRRGKQRPRTMTLPGQSRLFKAE